MPRTPWLALTLVSTFGALGCAGPSRLPARPPVEADRPNDALPDLVGPAGIRDQLQLHRCTEAPGPAVASGTVTNAEDHAVDIVVAVRWLEYRGHRVLDAAHVVVPRVPAGERATWELQGELPEGSDPVCTVQARAGRLAS